MSTDDDDIAEAIRLLLADEQDELPTSRAGRALRISGATLRTGARLTGRGLKRLFSSKKTTDDEPPRLDPREAVRLVRSIGNLKGMAMKAGQMLSFIGDALPPEYRQALALLQTHSQPLPFERIREVIQAELGQPPEALFAELEPTPVAAASVGQVHRGRLLTGEQVAVKVQYPGVEDAMRADFGNARAVGRFVDVLLPRPDASAAVAEMRDRFLEECDYRLEAASQARFASLLSNQPAICVPRVFATHSAQRVLTSEWQVGQTLREIVTPSLSQADRDRLGRVIYRFYIGTLYRHGLFNCDPHPGNYLFRSDGRVVFLDYGCVRTFPPALVTQIHGLARAAMSGDPAAMHSAAVALGVVDPDAKYDRDAAFGLLRQLYAPILEDRPFRFTRDYNAETFRRFTASKRNLWKLRMPPEMLFLNRINFGVFSVLAELGAELNAHRMLREIFDGRDPPVA